MKFRLVIAYLNCPNLIEYGGFTPKLLFPAKLAGYVFAYNRSDSPLLITHYSLLITHDALMLGGRPVPFS